MRITKGKVVNGSIVVEGEPLDEGAVVTVLVSDEHVFTLSPAEEATLHLKYIASRPRRIDRRRESSETASIKVRDVPIEVTPIADAHSQKAANWWLANREKAPQAFKEELQRVSHSFRNSRSRRESNEREAERHPSDSSQPHSIFLVLSRQEESRSRFSLCGIQVD